MSSYTIQGSQVPRGTNFSVPTPKTPEAMNKSLLLWTKLGVGVTGLAVLVMLLKRK